MSFLFCLILYYLTQYGLFCLLYKGITLIVKKEFSFFTAYVLFITLNFLYKILVDKTIEEKDAEV